MTFGLTAVAGLSVGHFTDARRPTGCTVVLAPAGAVCGVDVRGAAPGTRETELLSPVNAVEKVHAVLLSGGSAFGLDAAGGVMRWLDERGIGVAVGPRRADGSALTVPIVPAAILFDLGIGDATIRPDAAAGYAACEAATRETAAEGNVGAGAGASIGKLFGMAQAMRGGVGSASITIDGVTVAALVAVNAMGDVVDPRNGAIVAGARRAGGGGFVDTMAALRRGDWPAWLADAPNPNAIGAAAEATTLAVVATDARLSKAEATKVAQMAHDGLARTIRPIHTMSDGDVVFALATGAVGRQLHTTLIGALAAEVLADAVLRAVRAATSLATDGLPRLPAACDLSAGSPAVLAASDLFAVPALPATGDLAPGAPPADRR
ncbi:MAG: P1 family peptidase [Pseudomonadota bacterium]|nr:P1 family peptidase [Pseudomonadota bacterium]